MIRKLCVAGSVSAVSLLCFAAAAAASPIGLVLAGADAASLLALVCSPITQQSYATGFDPVTGQPEGDVYVSSTCTSSGRGGHSVLYSAWGSVVWNFDGSTSSFGPLSSAPSTNESLDVFDPLGDELYNAAEHAYLQVIVPASPTGLSAVRSGGRYLVSWVPDPTVPATLITSSTITATPVGSSSPAFSTTVTGQATSGLLGPLEPSTTYDVSVVDSNASGSTLPSLPITITTGKSVVRPGVPTGVGVSGIGLGSSTNTFTVGWTASSYGDSPTDSYTVRIFGIDGGGIHAVTVPGTALSTTFTVTSASPTWYIQVRAHDAAGWSAWSHLLTLGLD